MKPVKLTIEGVNSFIEPQTLDFEAVGRSNLFCISGKTGAGKTTIFDCIMLALYGKSTKGNLADVVNLSLMSARVNLEFTENGELYAVERTIKCRFDKDDNGNKTDRRIAISDCLLYKNGAPIAKGEEANDIILGIIGLEAAEFKNVYLLEQGEYAEFLKKTPAKQTEAVGKIFSLMRFGDVHKLASDRTRELAIEITRVESDIAAMGDVTPQALREQKDELKSLRTKTTALIKDSEARAESLAVLEKTRDIYISARSKQENVKQLMLQADEAKKREYAAKTALEEFEKALDPADENRLKGLRDELNKLSALNQIDKEYAATVAQINSRSLAIEKKREAVAAAQKRLQQISDRKQADEQAFADKFGDFIALSGAVERKSDTLKAVVSDFESGKNAAADIAEAQYRLMDERKTYKDMQERQAKLKQLLDETCRECEKRLGIIERYAKENESIAERLAAAVRTVDEARKRLGEAQLHSHAAAVRAELHAGDTCPVCGGAYDGESHGATDADVEQCKAALIKAEAEQKTVAAQKTECEKHHERAKTDYEGAEKSRQATQNDLSEIEEQMSSSCVLPEVYDGLIKTLGETKAAAEKSRQSAEQLLKQGSEATVLKTELDGLVAAEEELKRKAESFRTQLGENCGNTDGKISGVKSEIESLEKKFNETDSVRKRLTGDVTAATSAVMAIESSLCSAKAECPVDMPEFDEGTYAAMREESDRLKKQIAENEKDIAVKEITIATLTEKCDRLAELKKNCDNLKKRAGLYDKIAEITRGKAMLNYVAAEYIAEFTLVAGEILNDLSSGKYTMSYDKTNGFVVYDYLNEGKPRKTDTLSGGELFLASLSVAIAIARTQSRGNNAFFFLDEGFGTLDEDLIDVVYGALEALSKDCLVGVITHAEALISRMPFTVTVAEATDTCGSRIIQ
ncbi:MAG: SMC family ATPase [Clostridiales bacterium]|nr:SMC family ATPase [Clostridiales bacterium]